MIDPLEIKMVTDKNLSQPHKSNPDKIVVVTELSDLSETNSNLETIKEKILSQFRKILYYNCLWVISKNLMKFLMKKSSFSVQAKNVANCADH